MSDRECNYQAKVGLQEVSHALARAQCEHCGVTTTELMERGEILEICGEEFASDLVSGKHILSVIALCPRCHRNFHKDARGQHNPCQLKARVSRESVR